MEHMLEDDKTKIFYWKRRIGMDAIAIYEIILKSQLGPKFGTLVLKRNKKKTLATLIFLGHENILGGCIKEEELALKGKIITPLGVKDCFVAGTLAGDEIHGEITIGTRNYQVTGKKNREALVIKGEENEI
jgi:hypothetical protein